MQARTLGGSMAIIAAFGMTFGLLGGEIGGLTSWAQASAPAFVGKVLVHIGAVVAAYVAGQMLPSSNKLLPPGDRK